MAQHAQHARPAAPPSEDSPDASPRAATDTGRTFVRRLLGIGLLWISLAALVSVPATGGITSAILAGLGFVAFAAGLTLFADALKREIVASLRSELRR